MAQRVSVTSDQLEAHLRVDRYGDFVLTDAIRPAPHVPVRPRQGFRTEIYRDAGRSASARAGGRRLEGKTIRRIS